MKGCCWMRRRRAGRISGRNWTASTVNDRGMGSKTPRNLVAQINYAGKLAV